MKSKPRFVFPTTPSTPPAPDLDAPSAVLLDTMRKHQAADPTFEEGAFQLVLRCGEDRLYIHSLGGWLMLETAGDTNLITAATAITWWRKSALPSGCCEEGEGMPLFLAMVAAILDLAIRHGGAR